MKVIKRDEENKLEINLDISICLKKRKKRLKECQKNYREAKKSKYNNK